MSILDHILPARRRRIREVREVLLGETARHREARDALLAKKVFALMQGSDYHFIVREYLGGRLSPEIAQKILNDEIKPRNQAVAWPPQKKTRP